VFRSTSTAIRERLQIGLQFTPEVRILAISSRRSRRICRVSSGFAPASARRPPRCFVCAVAARASQSAVGRRRSPRIYLKSCSPCQPQPLVSLHRKATPKVPLLGLSTTRCVSRNSGIDANVLTTSLMSGSLTRPEKSIESVCSEVLRA